MSWMRIGILSLVIGLVSCKNSTQATLSSAAIPSVTPAIMTEVTMAISTLIPGFNGLVSKNAIEEKSTIVLEGVKLRSIDGGAMDMNALNRVHHIDVKTDGNFCYLVHRQSGRQEKMSFNC